MRVKVAPAVVVTGVGVGVGAGRDVGVGVQTKPGGQTDGWTVTQLDDDLAK
jgi:hypothetical protein